ncbi:hypothetical protein GQY17_26870 (plasmid) [Klebsiella pneumoniae]|uniref:hypothetical protein n=1 Tax=Klebsiella pneumoniae TaxID=573 RepID=UPI001303CC8D|nr:hypothetical protein [Klebsiella pneumoniae]QGZ85998.1 hypothetical protein GQY17_26870 [Klebsiella pneumoniae]
MSLWRVVNIYTVMRLLTMRVACCWILVARPGGNKTSGYASNDVVKNFCYTDDVATVGNAMDYDGGGIKSTGHYLGRVLLPDSAILPASCTRQLITLTFKIPVTGYDPQNNARQCALLSVGSGAADATTLSGILGNSNASGALNNMQFQAWGHRGMVPVVWILLSGPHLGR